MRVEINKITKGLDLFEKGTKVKSLTHEETSRFLQDLNYEMYQKGHVLEEPEKIKIGDILGSVEDDELESLEQIGSIDIGIIAYYRCFPSTSLDFRVRTKDGGEGWLWGRDFDTKISDEDIYFEKVTNHKLRGLFSESLLKEIEETKEIKLKVNGKEINLKEFLDEENLYKYPTEFSSDT